MKKPITLFLLAILFCFNNLNAQSFSATSGVISLNNIDSCSTTQVTITTFLGCINWRMGSSSYTVTGSTIDVRVDYSSTPICAGAISNPIFNTTLQNIPPGTYTVNGSAFLDNALSNTITVGALTVTSCSTVGFSENIVEKGFETYPNPSKGMIFIQNLTGNKQQFQLFDIRGKEVLNGVLNPQMSELDLNHLISGVYFIKYTHGDKQEVQKIVIQ